MGTETQAAGVTTYAQPAPVVTKQVHYGQTSYVSGHSTHIHKPPTPFLPISVSPYLRNTESVNAPIVKTETEIHTVNEPVYIERRVEVPYDVPVYKENIIQVPTPVHVDKPYAVPHPVPPHQRWSLCPPHRCCARCCCCQRCARRGCHPLNIELRCSPNTTINHTI